MSGPEAPPSVFHRAIYHQQVLTNRKDVVPPDLGLLRHAALSRGAIEVHRTTKGSVEWLIGATTPSDLQVDGTAYERLFPGGAVHPENLPCALPGHPAGHWTFAFARGSGHHWSPMNLSPDHDYADGLVRALASEGASGHEVVLQIVFRREDTWGEQFHLLASPKDRLLLAYEGKSVSMTGEVTKSSTPTQWHQHQHTKTMDRLREPAYHVEIRLAVHGPDPKRVIAALQDLWLNQFKGGNWRHFRLVKRKQNVEFDQAFRSHDMGRGPVNSKECRDVSETEFGSLFLSPWSAMHRYLRYYREHEGVEGEGPDVASDSPPTRTTEGPARPSRASSPGRFPAAPPSILLGQDFQREGVFLEDPWFHAAVEGATGAGKSTLLLQWILETLAKRPGDRVVVIDPTGTLTEAVKARLDPALARETLELDPARLRFTEGGSEKVSLPMNLLAIPDLDKLTEAQKTLAGDIIVGNLTYFIKNLWGSDLFGPQLEHNVSSLAHGLLEIPGTNLVDMYYVLTDAKARAMFSRLVRTETYRKFAVDELPRLTNSRYSQDRVSSTLNRLGKIVNNPLLRVSLCQRADPVDFKELLSKHRLILINLSKTTIGDEASHFLGAMLFARLWLAVLQRGPAKYHTYLFVDEFQNFVTPSIAHVLTEARKYNLHLVMANQYLGQIRDEVRDALVQNVNAWCFFRMGVNDQRLANAILRPGRRGWSDDTIISLADRRFLFVHRNRLETVYTLRPFEPTLNPKSLDTLVQASTRRYAADETSMHSPFSVDERQVGAVLEAIHQAGPLPFEELVARVKFHRAEIWAALKRAEQDGYLNYDPTTKTNSLTALGRLHWETIGAKHENRLEGEPHAALLTKVVQHLESLGVEISAVHQGDSDDSLPDAEIVVSGQKVNLEVECTTLKEGTQVIKNLLKAAAAQRRCLFVVGSREDATRLLETLSGRPSSLAQWRDFAILFWSGDRFLWYPDEGSIALDVLGAPPEDPPPRSPGLIGVGPRVPTDATIDHPLAGAEPEGPPAQPPVLKGTAGEEAAPAVASPFGETDSRPELTQDDLLVSAAMGVLTERLLRTWKGQQGTATYEEIIQEIPLDKRGRFTPTRIGLILKRLECETARVWDKAANRKVSAAVLVDAIGSAQPSRGEENPDDAKVEP